MDSVTVQGDEVSSSVLLEEAAETVHRGATNPSYDIKQKRRPSLAAPFYFASELCLNSQLISSNCSNILFTFAALSSPAGARAT